MPSESGYALGAAGLWAVSSFVINRGLTGLRSGSQPAGPAVVVGVLCSLTIGSIALGIASGGEINRSMFDLNVVLGGLLTFPIGTGLYYFTSVAYQDRAEVSSQYANVKPALSIALGATLFGETFGRVEFVVSLIIGIGIVVILQEALRLRAGLVPVSLGLALAIAWAGGEAFIRAATDSHTTLQISFGALLSSLVIFVAALGLYALVVLVAPSRAHFALHDFSLQRAHAAFCLHGLLSFGLAYTLLFHSIGSMGLSRTIMITVFWPSLALALGIMISRFSGRKYHISGSLITAFLLFTCASGIYVAATMLA